MSNKYRYFVLFVTNSEFNVLNLNHFTYKLSCSQLFERTAFCLTVCCSLYVLLVIFKNNIYKRSNNP